MSNVANITIDHTKVDADLTDFPIYIDLSDLPSGFWNTVSNGGADIRAYKDDGSTQLPVEVVSCNTGDDTGELHVKYTGTLSSSSDTTIQIHADGSSSEPASDSTYGSENVWGSDYKAVYHLEDVNDSTSNDNDGTNNGATSGETGQIGDAYSFDGDNDYVNCGDNNYDIANGYTLEAWIKTSQTSGYQEIIGRDDYGDSQRFWLFQVNDDKIRFIRFDSNNDVVTNITGNTNVATGEWVHIIVTFNGSGSEIFINGVSDASDSIATSNKSGTGEPILIGAKQDSELLSFFNGIIDEVKILDAALSSIWISTEYNNQSDTSTFYTASELPPEPITNYNKTKEIKVATVGGTPTISKAQCLKIEDGDDSTTGTGNIVLDWTNISSKNDIAVYDENDTLLDYYFESFDDSNNTAVIWVYRAWEQDDSVQAKIAYGDGSSDQSVGASTVFDNESDLVAGYLFNESSGDLLDVTSNGNDGDVNGATQGEDGIVGGAYSFDGVDDYVEIPEDTSLNIIANDKFSIEGIIELNSLPSGGRATIFRSDDLGASGTRSIYLLQIKDDHPIASAYEDGLGNSVVLEATEETLSTGVQYHFVFSVDLSGNAYLYLNGDQIASGDASSLENGINIANSRGIGAWYNIASDVYLELLDGIIDNIQFYNGEALSSNDAKAKYSATKSSPDFFSQEAGGSGETNSTNFFNFF